MTTPNPNLMTDEEFDEGFKVLDKEFLKNTFCDFYRDDDDLTPRRRIAVFNILIEVLREMIEDDRLIVEGELRDE